MVTLSTSNAKATHNLKTGFKRVFVSYTRANKQTVKNIVHALRSAGLEVFWDKDIHGDAWQDTLQTELYACDLFLVVIGSQCCAKAITHAISIPRCRCTGKGCAKSFKSALKSRLKPALNESI